MYYMDESKNKSGHLNQGDMTVTGDGIVRTTPDAATVQMDVITEAAEPQEAQQENTMIMTRVIQALLQMGIPRNDIQTITYQINPQYDYVDGEQVFRGYEVVHSLSVTISPINQVGYIIDTAVDQGVNRVSNIQFTTTRPTRYEQEALKKALKNAESKARSMARAINVTLDFPPTRVKEDSITSPIPYQKVSLSEASTPVPIEPGQIEFTARVTVQYTYH
ncbi:SIMPL domain-containing protein [Lentibacillus saliphilus]|uniref:SIMPL domain-containing protein n=1 Tax=Lentibacillus saliphilus TaxID=2737028 RepID=UPI001C30CF01|nr:SIMPL domain-containing protein [Lentibacillus saliphilus]